MEVAVATTRLIADFESVRQSFENSHHLIDRPHLTAVDKLACLIEDTNRNVFSVDVEPDVEHDDLRKLGP